MLFKLRPWGVFEPLQPIQAMSYSTEEGVEQVNTLEVALLQTLLVEKLADD